MRSSLTTYRHQVVTAAHLERVEQIIRDVCADSGTGLIEFNGEPGHVHLLVSFPPKAALSAWSAASRACRPAG
jgi:putative transposase